MYDHKELWKEVEHLQEMLHDIVIRKGINSPEAIRASQAFRDKMNEYSNSNR